MTSSEKMKFVIELAKKAMDRGELPIAAAIYHGEELISSAHTTECADYSPEAPEDGAVGFV